MQYFDLIANEYALFITIKTEKGPERYQINKVFRSPNERVSSVSGGPRAIIVAHSSSQPSASDVMLARRPTKHLLMLLPLPR